MKKAPPSWKRAPSSPPTSNEDRLTRISEARSALFLIALLRGFAFPQAAVNPLQGDLGVHDPALIKAGSVYVTFSTGKGIALKTSPDRITWRNAGSVFSANPAWHKTYVPLAYPSLWAADISFRDG